MITSSGFHWFAPTSRYPSSLILEAESSCCPGSGRETTILGASVIPRGGRAVPQPTIECTSKASTTSEEARAIELCCKRTICCVENYQTSGHPWRLEYPALHACARVRDPTSIVNHLAKPRSILFSVLRSVLARAFMAVSRRFFNRGSRLSVRRRGRVVFAVTLWGQAQILNIVSTHGFT